MTLVSRKRWQAEKRCCDKKAFQTRAQAVAALERKKRITYGEAPSGVYKCKRGNYHLSDRSEPTRDGMTEWEHVKAGVFKRDSHRCISCGTGRDLDVHHRKLQSQGGADVPQNCVTLCRKCHDGVHDYPLEAARAGLIVRRGADPLNVPVEHRAWGASVYLTSDYQYGGMGDDVA